MSKNKFTRALGAGRGGDTNRMAHGKVVDGDDGQGKEKRRRGKTKVTSLAQIGNWVAESPDAPELRDVARLDELQAHCLPGGDRAYRVGRGISAPHVKHAPDPSYDEGARQAKLPGTRVLLAVITPEGTTSAISAQRSLGEGLNEKFQPPGHALDQRAVEAVSKRKFEPAKFQSKPVLS